MKKRLLLFLMLILQVVLFAQPLSQREYQLLVTSNNKTNCPLYSDGCQVNSLSYKNNVLHFNIVIPEEHLQDYSVDDVRKYLSERLTHRQEGAFFTYMYDHLTDVKGGLSYDFHIEDDNKQLTDSSFSIRFSPEEYRTLKVARNKSNAADNKVWGARNNVQLMVKEINSRCPYSVDPYITFSSVSISGDMVIFLMVFNEQDDVTFSVVKEFRDNIESNLAKVVQSDEETYAEFIDGGYSIQYKYLDEKTKESFEITITKSRLEELLAQSEDATQATDAQMDAFMADFTRRYVRNNQLMTFDTTRMWMTSGEYENRILQFTMTANEGVYDLGMTPRELEVFKKTVAASFKKDFDKMLQTPEIYDGAIVTREHFYQHLQGVRLYVLEKNTHRGVELSYTTEELLNFDFPDDSYMPKVTNSRKSHYIEFNYIVESIAKERLPMNIGDDTLFNMQLVDGNLVMGVSLHSAEDIDTNEFKNEMFALFLSDFSESFWEVMLELELGICYQIHTSASSKPMEIRLSPEEVEGYSELDTLDSKTALKVLRGIVAEIQAQVHSEGESLGIDSVSLDEKNLTFFIALLDDEENVMDEFEDEYTSFKELIRQELLVDDEDFKYALQLCIYANMGFRYCFFDSHGRKVDFIFSVEEIEGLLEELQ